MSTEADEDEMDEVEFISVSRVYLFFLKRIKSKRYLFADWIIV